MSLNRDTKDPPYLLGRLLAALENLGLAGETLMASRFIRGRGASLCRLQEREGFVHLLPGLALRSSLAARYLNVVSRLECLSQR